MSETQDHPDSRKLRRKLQQFASPSGLLNYRDFIDIALYDPEYGYYRKNSTRVGRHENADFYTSQSMGPVFGALVMDAVHKILQQQRKGPVVLKSWSWVEAGYESDAGWWKPRQGPFDTVVQIGPGDSAQFSGRCVVFSNELFDAQPFHRIVWLKDRWHEFGVHVSGADLQETLLPELSPEVREFQSQLPLDVEEGYQLDLPLATRSLLKKLTRPAWSGLFIALDYGKSWRELIEDFPQGTARAYYKHRQSANLTAQPGMQDITCHICWDWLKLGLSEAGFQSITLESQEAFFVKHATDCIQQIISANPGQFDPVRQSLKQLIHPASMGQQFQALWAYRPESQGE